MHYLATAVLVLALGAALPAFARGDAKRDKQAAKPIMEHDEPYMEHVWQFATAGEYYFGGLVPGHFEGGMIGRLTVK